jgi:hypothetical protein
MLNMARLTRDPHFTRDFTVRRPGIGAFDAYGVWVTGPYDELPFTGSVQPATPKQMELLPSGTNIANVIAVWSGQELICDDSQATNSDVVIVDAKSYRVTKLLDWGLNGYWMALAVGYPT